MHKLHNAVIICCIIYSDGQRRRVQIFLGLLRPFRILLLDEVTVSLDVVVRVDLLEYLKKESIERECMLFLNLLFDYCKAYSMYLGTILYATHIFDGLEDWPTHLHYCVKNIYNHPLYCCISVNTL